MPLIVPFWYDRFGRSVGRQAGFAVDENPPAIEQARTRLPLKEDMREFGLVASKIFERARYNVGLQPVNWFFVTISLVHSALRRSALPSQVWYEVTTNPDVPIKSGRSILLPKQPCQPTLSIQATQPMACGDDPALPYKIPVHGGPAVRPAFMAFGS